ncbi:DUF6001 family protein [Roseobacter weihaiensis]|uniref:DUF6001 family protein n=1 Tax=Roseobacter weihaiensis TaxID=2763262 RepID=UPI001D0A6869|nr:DUF6001 family protein [Roseobacter sp. H9]
MSLDQMHTKPRSLAERRFANCVAFLDTRKTNFQNMLDIVAREIEGLEHMLLTSSAVHGLANSTSDIDTICVVDGADLKARTATQFFDGDNHFETIIFSKSEVAQELERLREAANGTAAEAFAAYKGWNKHGPMNRKYLERLVNGVTADGTSPFLAHLETLGPLWRAASLGHAIMAASCMTLSNRSAQGRAAVGYGLNALLFGMDAVMSHHGQVYSNKKWYRLRFSRFVSAGPVMETFRPFVEQIADLWGGLMFALREGTTPQEIFAGINDIVLRIDAAMGTEMRNGAAWQEEARTVTKAFLPGSHVCVSANRNALFMNGPIKQVAVGEETELGPDEAQNTLRAIRGGVLSIRFSE